MYLNSAQPDKLCLEIIFLIQTQSKITPLYHFIEILSGCVFVVRLQ